MASLVSVLIAFVMHYYGLALSKHPETCQESPPFTEAIFMLAQFILIWHTPIYPRHFRPLHWFPSMIIEVSVCKLLQEVGMNFLWCPFDKFLYIGLPYRLQDLGPRIKSTFGINVPNDLYSALGGLKLSTTLCYAAAFSCLASSWYAVRLSYKPKLGRIDFDTIMEDPSKIFRLRRNLTLTGINIRL